jgi:pyruvate dehydrogenase E2 component (dihydrolipoamide acetyltransferase)
VKVSPYARKLASEKGVSLAGLAGSGPGGRIVAADVQAAPAGSAVTAAATAAPATVSAQFSNCVANKLVSALP